MSAVINRNCDTPIIGPNGNLSRAARRAANRAKKDASVLRAWADTAIPAGLSLENRSTPNITLLTGLETSEERRHLHKEARQQIVGIGALPVGRPTEYTCQEADAICCWIQAGGSLRGYSRKTGRAVETVYRWLRENAEFQALLAHAMRDRADTMGEEIIEIADDSAINPTIEGVQAAKLRVEARKWVASKLAPTKWGDKQTVEHVGAVNIRIGIPAKAPQALVIDGATRAIPDGQTAVLSCERG